MPLLEETIKRLKLSLSTLERLKQLHPDIQMRFCKIHEDMYNWSGSTLRLKMTDGFRSFEEQAQLFAQGRTEPGKIVTDAEPGESIHNYGLAWDAAFEGKDAYLESRKDSQAIWNQYGSLCEKHGMKWGGKFKSFKGDNPHAEKTYGLTLVELKNLHTLGGLPKVWTKVDEVIHGSNGMGS